MGMEAVAQQLLAAATTTLNGTIEFDVSLLDTIVTAAYSPVDPNRIASFCGAAGGSIKFFDIRLKSFK